VYEPVSLFEVRHVNSDLLSAVTKTEQTGSPVLDRFSGYLASEFAGEHAKLWVG